MSKVQGRPSVGAQAEAGATEHLAETPNFSADQGVRPTEAHKKMPATPEGEAGQVGGRDSNPVLLLRGGRHAGGSRLDGLFGRLLGVLLG